MGFKGAGRVHGGLRGGALEGRRFFERGLDRAGDGDDVVCIDEVDLGIEAGLKCCEQLVGRGMDGGELGEFLLRSFGGIDFFGDARELCLVFVQVGEAISSRWSRGMSTISL